ncbi:hypothetical protein BV089_00166 [Haemophilus influenzae]|nr:hypothetical protein BV089_00166 [Haemophilus influenzae]
MKKFNQSLLATAMLLAAGGANAAAFQLAEISTSGLGVVPMLVKRRLQIMLLSWQLTQL